MSTSESDGSDGEGAQQQPAQSVVFDVFLGDPFRVDMALFDCWTRGISEPDAVARQLPPAAAASARSGVADNVGAHTRHQYHFFRLLAERLERPCSLLGRLELHVPAEAQPAVIERYYAFDDALARALVGKRLTNKLRSDLDDVCDATQIPLPACIRQFDNMRRVYKVALSDPTRNVRDLVAAYFRLPPRLVARYVRFAFFAEFHPTFDMKRMHAMPYDAIEALAEALVRLWTNGSNLQLEVSFDDVRAAKMRLKRDVEGQYRQRVLQQVSEAPAFIRSDNAHLLRALDGKFRGILKSLARIGAEIADFHEFHDLFENLQEKIVDVLRDTGMSKAQLAAFFDALIACANPDVFSHKHRPQAIESWRLFLTGAKECSVLLYDAVPSQS